MLVYKDDFDDSYSDCCDDRYSDGQNAIVAILVGTLAIIISSFELSTVANNGTNYPSRKNNDWVTTVWAINVKIPWQQGVNLN